MRWAPLLLGLVATTGGPLAAQSLLERTPNVHGVWTLDAGAMVFVVAHRFEIFQDREQLFSVPTLTLAGGLPFGVTAGLDFTSFSEAIPDRRTANETQYWLKRGFGVGERAQVAGMAAFNRGAGSVDGGLNLRYPIGRVGLLGEVRGFSRLFGEESAGAAGAVGASLALTRHLSLTGDVGRVLTADTFGVAWSAALAAEIPGSPHTISLQAANGGAITLQGASRRKAVGPQSVRFGFAFTVPLGTLAQWSRIVRPAPPIAPPPPGEEADHIVEMRLIVYEPAELRVRAGETVEWINLDPVEHTVTAEDESWGSEMMGEGQRYRRTFDEPGRYPYYCVPHPMMTGVVIVEP